MAETPSPLTPLAQPKPTVWHWLLLPAVAALLILPAILLLPPLLGFPRYEVADGQIMARSLASSTVIPAGTPVQQGPVTLGRKLVGSATAGYTVGRFGSDYGPLNVYSDGSQGRDALLFATQPRPTLLTPADPEALLIAQKEDRSATFYPTRRGELNPVSLFISLITLPILALLLMPRKPLGYELDRSGKDGGALVIRTGPTRFRLPLNATQAQVTTHGLGARLFGTGAPGYYTGTFAISSAAVPTGRVQAAASSTTPPQALLLTHAGKTYYLTPSEPEVVAGWFEVQAR